MSEAGFGGYPAAQIGDTLVVDFEAFKSDLEDPKTDTEKYNKIVGALERMFVALMELLGPAWHKMKSTLPYSPAFNAFLKWFPTMAVEMLPLRRNPETGEIELLMFPRSPVITVGNPPEYAGRFHTPGSMLVFGMTIREGLERVVRRETGVPFRIIAGLPPSPDTPLSPRGYEVPLCYFVELQGDLPANSKGVWIPLSELESRYRADTIIRAQYESFLKQAVAWLGHNGGWIFT